MLTELGVVLVLALANGFFALSEIAIVASRRSRIKQMARTSARARVALKLVTAPERTLSTVQVGITLLTLVTGVAAGDAVGQSLGRSLAAFDLPVLASIARPLGMVIGVALIAFINIVIGEMIPKRIALTAPERLATRVAIPMTALAWLMWPFVWIVNGTSTLALKLLGLIGKRSAQITEDEIRLLVAESAEQGVLDADERNMVNRVLRLGDRDVDSLMTPRPRIVWLDVEAPLADNLEKLRATPFSCYPVYRGDESDVVGVLETKRLIARLGQPQVDLFRKLAKPLYVPATARALDLLEEFRDAQTPLALVVDEYGDIDGLVTLNNVLAAVIGRSPRIERDGKHDDPIRRRDDGSYLIDGALSTDDLRELPGLNRLPGEDEHDFNTVAGMMTVHFGRIPEPGEWFEWHGARFEVLDLDGARIDAVLLTPARAPRADTEHRHRDR